MSRTLGALIGGVSLALSGVVVGNEIQCVPSRISEMEARKLIYALGELSEVKKAGGHPGVDEYSSDGDHALKESHYHYVVYDHSPRGRESADAGLLGYFSVQKDTARVIDIVLVKELRERKLFTIQMKLRKTHCMTAELLAKFADDWP